MATSVSARPPLKTKFSETYTALLAGKQPWLDDATASTLSSSSQDRPTPSRSKSTAKSNSGPRARYYADLLCLPVETKLVVEQLGQVSASSLVHDDPASQGALIRENVGSLWRDAIRAWRESDEDQVRRKNAVDTLVALSFPILTKKFSNYAFDVITVFAGGMDEADEVFTSLVDSIDDTLRGGSSVKTRIPSSVRPDDDDAVRADEWIDRDVQHRALQLGLLWLACVAQTSLAAYFLRRDFFVTASGFIGTRQGSVFAYEGALFLGLLATLGQSAGGDSSLSTTNPYAKRFRDWVDQDCMEKLLIAASTALQQNVNQYVELMDDTPATNASIIAGLASLSWISGIVSPSSSRKPSVSSASGDFSALPSSSAVIFLPIFLLSRSNQAFTNLILAVPQSDEEPVTASMPVGLELYSRMVSLASYLATHASTSPRSASYARMSLLTLLLFLYDPRSSRSVLSKSEKAMHVTESVRLCRQREPALSVPRKKRIRVLTTNLDVAICFLRYNLSKRLDVTTYLVSLKIVQRSIVLCSEQKVQLEYEWHDCWTALLGLASFIVTRYAEMKTSSDLTELIKALVSTLNSALIRSDHFLVSTEETHHLIYELVRMSPTLRRLVLLLDPATPADLNRRSSSGVNTPTLTTGDAPAPTPPKVYAQVAGWKNLERVIQAVEARLADWVAEKPSARRNRAPEISALIKIIATLNLEQLLAGGVEEERSLATDSQAYLHHDLEWLDKMQQHSLGEFVRHSCADILRILPIY